MSKKDTIALIAEKLVDLHTGVYRAKICEEGLTDANSKALTARVDMLQGLLLLLQRDVETLMKKVGT